MAATEPETNGPEADEEPEPYPPWNFSWVVEGELAAMAWPQNLLNLDYLFEVGIRHLVSLSPEKLPPVEGYEKIKWKLISVDEFEDPDLEQIGEFVKVCEEAKSKNEAVGVHCRMGRGRSGVMAACYLVKFKNLTPDGAIADIRATRPNAIETPEQEQAIYKFASSIQNSQ